MGSPAAFLSEASKLLAESLDYEETLATVTRLALPHLGAWCIVDVVEGDGRMRRLAIVHPDPAKQDLARQLEHGWPPERNDPLGVPRVMVTRESEVIPRVTDALLQRAARTSENLEILRALGIGSMMVVPLIAHGQVLGAMTFVGPHEGPTYGSAELSVAEDLAARCAVAIENARLYRQARRTGHAAQEASRAKSEFLAVTSHELRTPLNAIIGYVDLLEMGVDGELNAGQREKVHRIGRSARRLLRLVEQLLAAARLERGELSLESEPAEAGEAIRAAVALLEVEAHGRSLALEVGDMPEPVWFVGDLVRVEEILVNLIANACKFTEPGGRIQVSARTTRERPPTDRLAGDGPWVRIDVEDTGVGIPAEKHETIFEPFVQADPSLTRRKGGAGLGLSVSRDLARAMGGDLTLESTPGRGSRFTLWLPVPGEGRSEK